MFALAVGHVNVALSCLCLCMSNRTMPKCTSAIHAKAKVVYHACTDCKHLSNKLVFGGKTHLGVVWIAQCEYALTFTNRHQTKSSLSKRVFPFARMVEMTAIYLRVTLRELYI